MKIQDLLGAAVSQIEQCSGTPQLDAQVLLAHTLQKTRAWIIANPDFIAPPQEQRQFEVALKKLAEGEPLPYVLGKWEFFGLEFDITQDVLIPRPETELLVEKAIAWLKARPEKRNVIDIGTGSGAIAVSIAAHIPDAQILATDISPAALQMAKHNAKKHGVARQIEFVECDLLPASKVKGQKSDLLPLTFDLICSNPPYIPTATLSGLPIFGREPTLALDGGTDGLDIYRRLFKLAPNWLAPHGMLLLETEATLGIKVLSLAYDSFSNVNIHLHQDLAGCDRLLEIGFHEN